MRAAVSAAGSAWVSSAVLVVRSIRSSSGPVRGAEGAAAGADDQPEVCRFVDVGGDVVALVEADALSVVSGADAVEDRGAEAGGVVEDDCALVGFL